MLRSSICFGVLIIVGAVLAEAQAWRHEPSPVTGRFGFYHIDQMRRAFCRSFCISADTMSYLANIMCAVKCPELYLPHRTTTTESAPTTASPTTSGTTPIVTTVTTSSTTAPTTTTTTTTTTAATETPIPSAPSTPSAPPAPSIQSTPSPMMTTAGTTPTTGMMV